MRVRWMILLVTVLSSTACGDSASNSAMDTAAIDTERDDTADIMVSSDNDVAEPPPDSGQMDGVMDLVSNETESTDTQLPPEDLPVDTTVPIEDSSIDVESADTQPPPPDTHVMEDTFLPDTAPIEDTGEIMDTTPECDPQCTTFCIGGVCQPCPADMVYLIDFCMDTFEAPNKAGELPLVMYTFIEAEEWCQTHDKRLCFDDEWTLVCGGPEEWTYPYGNTHQPGICNDEETWLSYDQNKLNLWPWNVATAEIESLEQLFTTVSAASSGAATAVEHVQWLYQAEPSGSNEGCTNDYGVYDTCGNVEEWTRRRDGGTTDFHGNLKGRFWADVRTCHNNITTHGDYFRFYEIGFRCCRDVE